MKKNLSKSTIILICANIEWLAIKGLFRNVKILSSPLGEWFITQISVIYPSEEKSKDIPLIFFHAGWGKISSAASTQYVIDRWSPDLIINIGTCGGFGDGIERDTIFLVNKTIVYDIYEQMYDSDEHINYYTTNLDLSWVDESLLNEIYQTTMVSGDRDLNRKDIEYLRTTYDAQVGDWESGAIAFVAAKNNVRLLILRGVSDLVDESGGEAYSDPTIFEEATRRIMRTLVDQLPQWVRSNKPI